MCAGRQRQCLCGDISGAKGQKAKIFDIRSIWFFHIGFQTHSKVSKEQERINNSLPQGEVGRWGLA